MVRREDSSFKEKVLVLILGCLVALLIMEAAVRGIGYLARVSVGGPAATGSELRILCLGESTTFVGGKESFPALLEKTLHERIPRGSFRVFNGGIPGGDTSAILASLEGLLQSCRPALVVAMMGANDRGDRVPFTGPAASVPKPRLRVVRLAEYLKNSVVARREGRPLADDAVAVHTDEQVAAIEQAQRLASRGDMREALAAYEAAIRMVPDSPVLRVELAELLLTRADREQTRVQAQGRLLALVRDYPHFARAWLDLAACQFGLGDMDLASGSLHRACEESWEDVAIDNDQILFTLLNLNRTEPEPLLGPRLEELCASHPANARLFNHTASFFATMGDRERSLHYRQLAQKCFQDYYCSATSENYRRLRDRLARQDIPLVCVQYAGRSVEPLRRTVGSASGVWFADTEREFAQARRLHTYRELFLDRCYGDLGHATALGNGIIADRVADAIVRANIYTRYLQKGDPPGCLSSSTPP